MQFDQLKRREFIALLGGLIKVTVRGAHTAMA
jgi:TRAP-type uncharacterized transport system substrate-binding protein